jgi:hypothetical protein
VNGTASDEITTYVDGVRRALAGIAPATRDELLEDLPEHLAEVKAEGIGTLTERLGTPETYARELLATAGVVGGFPEPPPNPLAQLHEVRDNTLRLLNRADVRVGPVIGYEKASDFLVLLRPGWWVLRGYLIAMAVAYLLSGDNHNVGLLPRVADSDLVALVLLAGCLVVSILLGQRTLTYWPRYALWSGTAVLVLFAWAGFLTADSTTRQPTYDQMGTYNNNPYGSVSDVFVYDGQGQLVTGARLYDQDGNPLLLGNNTCTDPNTGETSRSRTLGYPFCPGNAPFGADPSATPSATAPPSATPTSAPPNAATQQPSPTSSAPPPSASAPPAPSTSPSH